LNPEHYPILSLRSEEPTVHNPTAKSQSIFGTAKRLLIILALSAAAAVVVALVNTSHSSREPVPPPPPEPMAKMSPKKLQSHASDNGVMGGAHAADKTMAVSISRTTTESTVAIQPDSLGHGPTGVKFVHIRSTFPHPSKEKALNDALAIARDKVIEYLRNLDRPVLAEPTLEDIRTKYMNPESIVEVKPTEAEQEDLKSAKLEADRVWVEIDVEVTEDHIRELRSQERTTSAGWIGAAAFLLLGSLVAFLRFDAWTKGYLTTILALSAAALAGGGLAFLAFMR